MVNYNIDSWIGMTNNYKFISHSFRKGWMLMNMGGQAVGLLAGMCAIESVCALGQAAPATNADMVEGNGFASFNAAGQEAIRQHDYVLAERNFQKAKEAALQAGKPELVRDMDARRAAMYINDSEPSRAVLILGPYIKPGVNKFILSDYLMALRLTNQPKEAAKVFDQYVTDWQSFPVYGLQSMGDMYLRQRKYRQAAEIYMHILSREKVADVPYVQLGYALALARQGKQRQAAAAYQKAANLAPRYNNAIAGDGIAFIAEGRVGLARKLFASLGNNDRERDLYQLRYAQALVNANQDYDNEAVNFKRDERLSGRSYYHEAARILRRLSKSQNEDIAHEAKVAMAANKMNNELLADSRRGLRELLAKDHDDMAAQAVQGEYERLRMHSLTTAYENTLDNRRAREQKVSLGYDSYWGHNFYVNREYARRFLQDDDDKAAFWQSTSSLRRAFDWGELGGSWLRYDGAGVKSGYSLSCGLDFSDVTKMELEAGRRLHGNTGAVLAGIRENYQELSLTHQLTPQTSLQGDISWAQLTDENRYREYGIEIRHLLQVKHNYSDRLQAGYSRGQYARDVWTYDSPWRRDEYTLSFIRKWNLPRKAVSWRWQSNLNWSRDNDESMGFSPYMRLIYQKGFKHNQNLTVGATYRRYYRQTDNNGRHRDGYGAEISYNWEW